MIVLVNEIEKKNKLSLGHESNFVRIRLSLVSLERELLIYIPMVAKNGIGETDQGST